MILFAKIINEKTGLCEVGFGTDYEFYKSIGMSQMDVEKSDVDDYWYLSEKCPHKSKKQQQEDRRKDFESKFIETSWGWYRKEPKGYSNAPQSIDIIDRLVTKFNGFIDRINAMMIFYEKPDFSDASQCTEEWLVAHQYTHGACTKQEFEDFYIDFQTRWAMNQYK